MVPRELVAVQSVNAYEYHIHILLCFVIVFDRDLYLDGNFLECEGVIELIKLFASTAEMEAIERAEKKETEFAEANTLSVPGVPSAMSSVSRPTSSVSVKSKPARWVGHTVVCLCQCLCIEMSSLY